MTPSIPAYPNLLCPGSPVLLSESYAATFGRSEGIVFDCGNEKAQVAYHEDCRPALIPLVELRLSLATDTGMCHAARWLATRLGLDPGATAPSWECIPPDDDGMGVTPAHYRLTGAGWARVFTEETGLDAEYFFGDPRPILRQTRSDAGVEAYEAHPWRPTTVPGILGMGPAAALAAACVAVGGAS